MTRFRYFLAVTGLLAGFCGPNITPALTHQGHIQADPNAIIYNGNFSDGTDRPDHWLLVPPRRIIATGLLDTSTMKSAPSSLRVTVTGREPDAPKGAQAPGLQACVQQIFNRVPTRSFTVAGSFKKEPALQVVRVVVRAKDADWHDLATIPVTTQPGSDWTAFSQQMTLPPYTAAALISFEVQGQGSAWLDDVTVTENP